MKEELLKTFNVRLPKSLFDNFKKASGENYKTVSESMRDLMQRYIRENESKKESI